MDTTLKYSKLPMRPFRHEQHVTIGQGVSIWPRVSIGSHTYINGGVIRSDVSIGRFCSISYGVSIGFGNHAMGVLTTSPFGSRCAWDRSHVSPYKNGRAIRDETEIGHDVWIGLNVVISKGVRVGSGSIIGAGAIVTKDIPPYSVVIGSPPHVVRRRFPDDVCDALIKSEWWTLPPDVIQKLPVNNIKACVVAIEAMIDVPRLAWGEHFTLLN